MRRALDLNSIYNKSDYKLLSLQASSKLNEEAILNDWTIVGRDIWGAYDKFKKEAKIS